jgi:hypothetical protein
LTKEEFGEVLASTRSYVVLVLRAGPKYEAPGPRRSPEIQTVIAAHAMRNSALQKAGFMPVVCPIADGTGVTGIGVFDLSQEDATRVMDGDPAVKAGILAYELHPCFSLSIPLPTPALRQSQ